MVLLRSTRGKVPVDVPAALADRFRAAGYVDVSEPGTPPSPDADGSPAVPKKSASRAAWAAYADALGVSYRDGATRDQIRDAIT